jgi:hypothetical protein
MVVRLFYNDKVLNSNPSPTKEPKETKINACTFNNFSIIYNSQHMESN